MEIGIIFKGYRIYLVCFDLYGQKWADVHGSFGMHNHEEPDVGLMHCPLILTALGWYDSANACFWQQAMQFFCWLFNLA